MLVRYGRRGIVDFVGRFCLSMGDALLKLIMVLRCDGKLENSFGLGCFKAIVVAKWKLLMAIGFGGPTLFWPSSGFCIS